MIANLSMWAKTDTAQTLQETGDLVTLTEEILNGKLNFLCGAK